MLNVFNEQTNDEADNIPAIRLHISIITLLYTHTYEYIRNSLFYPCKSR